MKKLIFLIAVALFGINSAHAQIPPTTTTGTPKFAHVDFESILKALPERQLAEDSLKRQQGRLEADLKRMDKRLNEMYEDYKVDEPNLTADLKSIRANEIQEYEQRMVQFQQYAEGNLSQLQESLLTPLLNKVKEAIAHVARENAVTYVLDISTMVFYEGGFDLTPLVKQYLKIP